MIRGPYHAGHTTVRSAAVRKQGNSTKNTKYTQSHRRGLRVKLPALCAPLTFSFLIYYFLFLISISTFNTLS